MTGDTPYIEVLRPGMYSTIQDNGRYGYRNIGVPTSGAMDLHSFRYVNHCLGNLPDEAVLEATLTGPELFFHSGALICISGAESEVYLDGNIIPLDKVVQIRTGQILKYGKFISGCRSYMGIMGGLDIIPIMGSKSPLENTDLRPLKKGDLLPLKQALITHHNPIEIELIINHNIKPLTIDNQARIMVYPGPEWDLLDPDSKKWIIEATYTITTHADSIGYRLKGQALQTNGINEILSSAVLPGTVQLLPDGNLIILMRDCQTTGGYPRILQVAEDSINQLAQRRPGADLQFGIISI